MLETFSAKKTAVTIFKKNRHLLKLASVDEGKEVKGVQQPCLYRDTRVVSTGTMLQFRLAAEVGKKSNEAILIACIRIMLVEPWGFEPQTSSMPLRRSTN